MADERASVRKPAVAERRTAVAPRLSPVAATARPMPAVRTLHQRLGNRGTQAFAAQVVARSSAPGAASTSGTATGQLSLSHPGDAHEREAESLADKVMRMAQPAAGLSGISHVPTPSSAAVVQRRCAACEQEHAHAIARDAEATAIEPQVRRHKASSATPQITPSVSADIRALQGRGSALPQATRAFFEPRFGANFSRVRIHTDTHAARTASSINAKAFTVGHDIAFSAGQFSPDSQEGRHLLAHELTHVVQQSGGSAGGLGRAGLTVSPGEDRPKLDAAAGDARVVGRDAISPASLSPASPGEIQRYSWDDFKKDASGALDTAIGVAQSTGQAVAGAFETVKKGATAAGEWAGEKPSAVGKAAADAWGSVKGKAAEVMNAVKKGVHITVPDVTLFNRRDHTASFTDETDNAELYSKVVEVPYIGPVVLTLFTRGEMLAAVGVGMGPGMLRQISLDLDPRSDTYKGTARLEIPADLTGTLSLTGILGGSANWACLLNLVKVEGGLGITGSAGLNTDISQTVNIRYKDGEFILERFGSLTPCLNLILDLDALAKLIVVDFPLWSARWNLERQSLSKCWPIPLGELPGSGFKGGGGSSGGGGASGSFDDKLTGAAGKQPFSAANVINSVFTISRPVITTKPLPINAIEKSGKENPCPVPRDEAEQLRKEIREKLQVKYLSPGSCAVQSIASSNPKGVSNIEQLSINALGAKHGCHHCDEKNRPGYWVGDHQPATGLIELAQREPEIMAMMTEAGMPTTLAGQRLFPHSRFAQVRQGGAISGIIGKLKKLKRLKGNP